MKNVVQGFLNRLGSTNSVEDKIEYPDDHYEITKDPKENLYKFEDALEIIKKKYQAYNFEAAFKEKFGEELSPDDFQYNERIEEYCARNNVSKESLDEFRKERLKIRELGNRKIFEFVTHAEALLYYRGEVCPDYMLSKLARIEKLYGNKERAVKFNQLLEKARAEKTKIKEGAKWTLLKHAANIILNNIAPYGKTPAIKENWVRVVDLVAEKLRAKGIDIIEDGHSQEIYECLHRVIEEQRKTGIESLSIDQDRATEGELSQKPVQTSQTRKSFEREIR
ncbi:MAG: hypothetical protein GX092_07340 [Clostridia bacterium]|nr:hypothetical protein [Clostridia bacterium]